MFSSVMLAVGLAACAQSDGEHPAPSDQRAERDPDARCSEPIAPVDLPDRTEVVTERVEVAGTTFALFTHSYEPRPPGCTHRDCRGPRQVRGFLRTEDPSGARYYPVPAGRSLHAWDEEAAVVVVSMDEGDSYHLHPGSHGVSVFARDPASGRLCALGERRGTDEPGQTTPIAWLAPNELRTETDEGCRSERLALRDGELAAAGASAPCTCVRVLPVGAVCENARVRSRMTARLAGPAPDDVVEAVECRGRDRAAGLRFTTSDGRTGFFAAWSPARIERGTDRDLVLLEHGSFLAYDPTLEGFCTLPAGS
jgi:hypothetical protein